MSVVAVYLCVSISWPSSAAAPLLISAPSSSLHQIVNNPLFTGLEGSRDQIDLPFMTFPLTFSFPCMNRF